jgi:hypothetical protein
MAEIQIIGNILNTTTVSRYSSIDTNLISSQKIQEEFNPNLDYIEYYLYDTGGNLINSDYSYNDYTTINQGLNSDGTLSILNIDPIQDIENLGYNSGEFNSQYNFFRNRISDITADLFIIDISSDRTEIRATSINIPSSSLFASGSELINEINNSPYYVDYLLNFGSNQQVVAVNVALENLPNQVNILFKLYQPLPQSFSLKSSFWVVSEIINPYVFNIDLSTQVIPDPLPTLRGPNFDIQVSDHNTIQTGYQTYNSLVNSVSSSNLTSYQNYLNLISEKGLSINVDYNDFSNFSHFGSSAARIQIFYNKVQSIENYNNYINSNSSSIALQLDVQTSITNRDNIVIGFDGFERFMYFESGSNSWPKVDSNKPYVLQSTGSTEVINWFNNILAEATEYDNENLDWLIKIIPDYISEDDSNQNYITFVNMVGHFFDNIWIYVKSITDLYNANNDVYVGISKDLVYLQLKSLGTNLYNGESSSSGSAYLTGYYEGDPTEYATLPNSYLDNISRKDLVAELYKRLYHNLPLLVKGKGSSKGLNQLITAFGIPENLIPVREFGGTLSNDTLSYQSDSKIRIINNEIEDNVLSPFLSLEIPESDRSIDTQLLDISFSPLNEIDSDISGSVNNLLSGSFRLDDYIGDPRQEYSSSYTDLNNLRIQSIDPLFSIRYDFGGFIRLMQYFDNSLFKMLQDNVPARSILFTGITIRPQNLERPKIKMRRPGFDQIQIFEADYRGMKLSSDSNSTLYKELDGDKSAFYTGEFSGSEMYIHPELLKLNSNPYIHPTTSIIDYYQFGYSDYNVLDNNVFQSRLSQYKRLIDGNYTGAFAEFQDYYDSLSAYKMSHYDGTKVTSTTYNVYTQGDNSYGKTAAIDIYSQKLGLLVEVTESRFLPQQNNIVLKYLVDEFGNLTELNEANNNWFEVQNTFLMGDTLTISLFNTKNPSDQKTLNGVKSIYNSGYSYNPVYYVSSSDTASAFVPPLNSVNQVVNVSSHFSGGGPLSGSFHGLFGNNNTNVNVNGGNSFQTGSSSVNPTFTALYSNDYIFNLYTTYFAESIITSTNTSSISLTVNLIKNASQNIGTRTYSFTPTYISPTEGTSPCYLVYPGMYGYTAGFTQVLIPYNIYDSNGNIIAASGSAIYRGTFSTDITGYDVCTGVITTGSSFQGFVINPQDFLNSPLYVCYSSSVGSYVGDYLRNYNSNSGPYPQGVVFHNEALNHIGEIWGDNYFTDLISLNANDTVQLSYTASFPSSSFVSISQDFNNNVTSPLGNYITLTSAISNIIFNPPNQIIITGSLFGVMNDYYDPSVVGFSSSLYESYGDVDFPFIINPGDLVKVVSNSITYILDVSSVQQTSSSFIINTAETFNITTNITEVLFISRVPDETNIIINFNKRPGQTSLGLVVPENVDPNILSSINDITSVVKTKLIDLENQISS